MATLDISNNTIATATKKCEDGFLEEEKRGTASSVNKVSEDLINGVKDHINSFPRVESHYCRARTEKEYIDGSLNVSIMFRLYKEKCEEDVKEFVKESTYRKIFCTNFNISFFKPKKDQCTFCLTYEKYSTENEKNLKKEEYDEHKKNVSLARAEKDNDKISFKMDDNNNTTLASFDLQAVIQIPNGDISAFYYKSKLNVYNFTIFEILAKEGYCYLWNEAIAKRGAIEISTCVYLYLKNYCQGKDEVIFYSDNCVAQNKNKYMYSMYLYAVKHLEIKRFTHKYLIIGHTENEGDSIHACIEKEKKHVLKQGPLFEPSDIAMIIRCAKKNGPKYRLKELETGDFIDWKKLSDRTGKNFNSNTDREKCTWNSVKMIEVNKTEPFVIKYKTPYDTRDEYKTINIRQRGRMSETNTTLIQKAYSQPPKIPSNKLRDLMSLCDSGIIPARHHNFFKALEGVENDGYDENDGAL